MITSVHIENFKCFKEFDIELGKFNVLIGPNGSGKTSFLQAIGLVAMVLEEEKQVLLPLDWFLVPLGLSPGPHLVRTGGPGMRVVVTVKGKDERLPCTMVVRSKDGKKFSIDDKARLTPGGRVRLTESPLGEEERCHLREEVSNVGYYNLDPRVLKQPTKLSAEWATLKPNGEGLASLLNFLLGHDRTIFDRLEKAFCDRFPEYTGLIVGPHKLRESMDVGLALQFRTRNGQTLPAEAVSDGTMFSLAFLAVTHAPNPCKTLLIEEPEFGVHHASLKEIVTSLRALADREQVQVVLTTHSPYLLDCVEPEEVTVFRKDKDGAAHAARLSEYPDVEDLKKHFMTGEIWSGMDEDDIVTRQKVSG